MILLPLEMVKTLIVLGKLDIHKWLITLKILIFEYFDSEHFFVIFKHLFKGKMKIFDVGWPLT